jgi:5-methylcytosine-specific restriction endonuclease McrA
MPTGWEATRSRVLRESDICYVCGLSGSDEVDHIVPRHKLGGETRNLAPIHSACHSRKSSAEGHARKRELRALRKRPLERHPGSR